MSTAYAASSWTGFGAAVATAAAALAGLLFIALVPSVLSAIIFGLINVWVLLVEILR